MAHDHAHTPSGKNKRRLAVVLGLTTLYLAAEVSAACSRGASRCWPTRVTC